MVAAQRDDVKPGILFEQHREIVAVLNDLNGITAHVHGAHQAKRQTMARIVEFGWIVILEVARAPVCEWKRSGSLLVLPVFRDVGDVGMLPYPVQVRLAIRHTRNGFGLRAKSAWQKQQAGQSPGPPISHVLLCHRPSSQYLPTMAIV